MSKTEYLQNLVKETLTQLMEEDSRFIVSQNYYNFYEVTGELKVIQKNLDHYIHQEIESDFVPGKNLEEFIDECLITDKVFTCDQSPLKNYKSRLTEFKTIFPYKEKISPNKLEIKINSRDFKEGLFKESLIGYLIAPTGLLTSQYAPKTNE
ncbi:hypothetical protein HN992_02470 [Candidatus Woesearchaeota archaeon]|nr:hypothetical protein [Candidatus Woesearchaeota archaeon]MBT3439013.1 hypothetical protein [Candidatus Woesearchaeota archaeon]MBT4058643.1 hypothetical protein [Candidatus Woesearchaeota archaeon]MBT4209226.1 hypothetical protein [Candidatus Woesearchaeota archaeon]MBT4730407.1 hypothetical protein [Candidatus Woesearchaeota archaeon]